MATSIDPSIGSVCPTGFIAVPGSGTYGTNDFCVMKYEAKADYNADGIGDTSQTTTYNTWPANNYSISNSNKLVSTAAGYPVANISQTTAITAAQSFTANCTTGCHLITEAEWMTIAQNVLSVPSNWNGGVVGNSYIPRGNSDSAVATDAIADLAGVNKRALTLSNGEVIWDLAGNVWEWTSATTTGGQPGITGTGGNWRQWNVVSNSGTISPNPSATATGIANANNWTSAYGIGQIWSNTEETGLRGFIRGGNWLTGDGAGVLTLYLNYAPSYTNTSFGFRVAAP